jgi:hypothetical protein
VDSLSCQLRQELGDVPMGVDGSIPSELAAAVQALGVGQSDLDCSSAL